MGLSERLNKLTESIPYRELVKNLREGEHRLSATNLHGSSKTLLASLLFHEFDRTLLYLVSSDERRRKVAEDFRTLLGEDRVVSIPPRAVRRLDEELPHMRVAQQRVEAVTGLTAGNKVVAVVPALSAIQMFLTPRRFNDMILNIRTGNVLDMEALVSRLEELGYVREDVVYEVGTYSRRGGIVDISGFEMGSPVRIEFDDDRIVSMREFDPATQRSTAEKETVRIVPIEEGKLSPFECSIFEYFPVGTITLVDEPSDFMRAVGDAEARLSEEQHLIGTEQLNDRLRSLRTIRLSSLHLHSGTDGSSIHRFETREPVPVNRKFSNFIEALGRHRKEGYSVFLLCDNEGQEERLRELLGTLEYELELVQGSLGEGFLVPDAGIAVYTDHEIFARPRRIRYVREYRGAAPIESFTSIKPGDYLVHINYGIARYEGIRRIDAGGGEIECLALRYAGEDRVYVPVDRLSLVEKYSTEDAAPPALDRIGSRRWERLKRRTKESIKEMANELLELYASRKVMKGFSFSCDTPWQMELESAFIYEDTPDQRRASDEVKQDMESPVPMDRLVCGDVGYGKTEVAIRAAFKAVQDGKQVVVLVPTTVLAQQHLMTFRSRLGMFPVKIEMMSRFLSKKEQAEVLAGLRKGSVDIVIGTHRLLSGDVKFKDLGFMIIDEEHRFGVKQKETLKKMRKSVDVLALSATPIPRTLYLSLMGMRDMSIIETPPRDRVPISTYVTRWNEELIRDAIMRETDRGGQVYFIHNRISSITAVYKMLERLLPGLRIEIAHGRMHARRLEKVMLSFLEGDVDVLLSTMIVESGLDIPNANTLIVNRADMFGLAQLYQLRGRVGRSNRQASAYFLIPPKSYIDQDARRRLRVLEEYTDLGSGYWIALKDLELRGAGNILGAQQHGFITSMGFDTYYRLLDEAIREIKGGAEPEKQQVEVLAGIEAYLSDDYMGSQDQKLSLYRRLSKMETVRELNELQDEIVDRFGPIPEAGRNLLKLLEVKIVASGLGIKSISIKGKTTRITFHEGHPLRMDRWNEVLERRSFGLRTRWDGKGTFNLESRGSLDALESLRKVLHEASL